MRMSPWAHTRFPVTGTFGGDFISITIKYSSAGRSKSLGVRFESLYSLAPLPVHSLSSVTTIKALKKKKKKSSYETRGAEEEQTERD